MNKNLIILFVLIALMSVGGVNALDINDADTQSTVDINIEDSVLTDNSLYTKQNNISLTDNTDESLEVTLSKDSDNNVSCENLINESDVFQESFSSDVKFLETNNKSLDILGDVCFDREVIVNPDFEVSYNLDGWSNSDASIYSNQRNAYNGKHFVCLNENGYISQLLNLATVDYIGFWYMSQKSNSKIEILLDNQSVLNYTIKKSGLGKWEYVLFNVLNYTEFHTLKLVQHDAVGYVDCFNLVRNDDIYVNFTLTDYSLVGDNLTLSFNDYSYGIIKGYLWDFGDGTNSTLQNVTHSFKNGHYTVSLKAYNENTTKVFYYTIPITFPTNEHTGVEYSSVQSAIDNAVDGDVINVYNNIFYNKYAEDLIINKSLTLNFYNCSLSNSIISVVNGANVTINEICLNNVSLKVIDGSNLTFTQLGIENMIITDCNIIFTDTFFRDTFITFYNSNVTFRNCNISNGGVFAWDCNLIVSNCVFNNCSEAIAQHEGDSIINSNIFHDNNVGVNIIGGSSNLSVNVFYYNNISLLFNSSNVTYDDNWWGSNAPEYIYAKTITTCDVCQVDGVKNEFNSWLILNISQSLNLSPDYFIVGITYYNLTFDLTHNNWAIEVSDKGYIKDFILNFSNIQKFVNFINIHPLLENKKEIIDYFVSDSSVKLINSKGENIFTLGYLTSNFTELILTILNKNYTVYLNSDTSSPCISYITPTSTFNDNLTIEIVSDDSDAIIFYTLDGTNPGYSSTRLIYSKPFPINESSTLHYTIIDSYGNYQKDFIESVKFAESSGGNVYKENVVIEIIPYSYDNPIYYTMDGENPINFNNHILYIQPFIVKNLTKIRFCEIYGIYNLFQQYLIESSSIVNFYNFDFSVNYFKNSSINFSTNIWSKYQGDCYNGGVSEYHGPITKQSSWVNDIVSSSGSVVIDDKGHIIVGGDDGYLYYLNNQGLVIWRYGTTSKIICTPTLGADGNIYFSNWMNSSLYCLSPSGQLLWKYHLGDYNTGTSPIFGFDNYLYVLTSNFEYSTLFVFKDGLLMNKQLLPFISASNIAINDDGLLYLISSQHELIILNFDGSINKCVFIYSGSMLNKNTRNTHMSVSIDSNGTLYVLNHINSADWGNEFIDGGEYEKWNNIWYQHVINAFYSNGTMKWTTKGVVYNGYYIVHTNPYTGNNCTRDDYSLDEVVSGTPSYYKEVLYITGNNKLIAINASNGDVLWMNSISSSGDTLSSPLISADEILYVTSNNMVYAFNLTGDKLWEYEIKGKYGNPISYSSPVLSNDGTLIVTTNQGIFAFRDIAADFTYYHVNGTATTIQFTDKSTPGNNRYYWMFGDGNFSRDQNPIHEYATGGKYRVVLLVEHNGSIDLARNTTIEVVYHDIVPPSNVTAYINDVLTSGGVFNQTQYIVLNASDYSDFIIYYTVDGTNPINSSTHRIYNGLIDIEVDTILKMVAVDSEGNIGNVTNITFIITDALNIHDLLNSSLINDIQELLDSAEPGSKIVFDYGNLSGANFTINKPLNIISNNNTLLIGNNVQPVFTFTKEAEGSTLNGFTINNTSVTGILINNANNVNLKNCNINVFDSTGIYINRSQNIIISDTNIFDSSNGIIINESSNSTLNGVIVGNCSSNGVWIQHSNNTIVSNSLFEDNGKDPYKLESGINNIESINGKLKFIESMPASESKTTQILIDNCINTQLYNNIFDTGYFGVRLYRYNNGVVIENNIFYESVGDAILLSNSYVNINITHNTIDGCYNGINFMGYSENVTIKQNTIKNLHEHERDLQSFVLESLIYQLAGYVYEYYFPFDQFYNHCYNGIQVSQGASNFHEGNTMIFDNVIIKVQHRAWEARKYLGYIDSDCDSYGYNLMDGSDSYHGTGGATSYHEGKVDLVLDRIGDATFRLRLINRLDNHYLSEIPEFDVIFTTGGFTQTVKFINDSAIAEFDVAMAVSDIEAIISGEIRKSAHFDIPITEGYSSTNRAFDPGFEKGEAYDNPDPVIPKIPPEEDDYKPVNPTNPTNPIIPEEPEPIGYGNGTGNGQGNGDGQGTGTGDGNGDSGSFGNGTGNVLVDIISDTPGMIGDALNVTDNVKSENVLSNVEDSQELGEAATTEGSDDSEGMDRSSEGGSDAGSGETVNAYEVSKVINVEENGWQFVIAVVLLSCFVLLGYVYRKRKWDGDDF